jgi:glycosyltransferase involved in cell wall biosynthesis
MKICTLADARSIRVQRLARGLAERGHHVRVVSFKHADIPGVCVEPYRVPAFGIRYRARWAERRRMYLRRLFREHDVVHVQFLQDFGLTSDLAAVGRLVVSPLGSDVVKPPDIDAYPEPVVRFRRDLLRMAHAVCVSSRAFAGEVARFGGIPEEAIDIVPMGVDLDRFRPRPRSEETPPTVGFYKGFKPVYGPTVLARAVPTILRDVPSTRFEFIGRGPQREACRAWIDAAGAAHAVNWLDPVPHAELPGRLARWDVCAIPSICESFCVAALEAQAMEIPVVASRVGGLVETVRDGSTGLLVPPGDPDALAAAVVPLLRDATLRRSLGAAGRRLVAEAFDWNQCVQHWEAVYRRVACGSLGNAHACRVSGTR